MGVVLFERRRIADRASFLCSAAVAEVKTREDGSAEWTRFETVPPFVLAQAGYAARYGEAKADISFGGNFFAQVKWPDKEKRISPDIGRPLSDMGQLVKKQINEKMTIQHPTKPDTKGLHFCTFWHEPDRADSFYRNVHVFSDGKMDRSPGGTGTSAMMAMFEARGQIKMGQTIRSEGMLAPAISRAASCERRRSRASARWSRRSKVLRA